MTIENSKISLDFWDSRIPKISPQFGDSQNPKISPNFWDSRIPKISPQFGDSQNPKISPNFWDSRIPKISPDFWDSRPLTRGSHVVFLNYKFNCFSNLSIMQRLSTPIQRAFTGPLQNFSRHRMKSRIGGTRQSRHYMCGTLPAKRKVKNLLISALWPNEIFRNLPRASQRHVVKFGMDHSGQSMLKA